MKLGPVSLPNITKLSSLPILYNPFNPTILSLTPTLEFVTILHGGFHWPFSIICIVQSHLTPKGFWRCQPQFLKCTLRFHHLFLQMAWLEIYLRCLGVFKFIGGWDHYQDCQGIHCLSIGGKVSYSLLNLIIHHESPMLKLKRKLI